MCEQTNMLRKRIETATRPQAVSTTTAVAVASVKPSWLQPELRYKSKPVTMELVVDNTEVERAELKPVWTTHESVVIERIQLPSQPDDDA